MVIKCPNEHKMIHGSLLTLLNLGSTFGKHSHLIIQLQNWMALKIIAGHNYLCFGVCQLFLLPGMIFVCIKLWQYRKPKLLAMGHSKSLTIWQKCILVSLYLSNSQFYFRHIGHEDEYILFFMMCIVRLAHATGLCFKGHISSLLASLPCHWQ